MAPPHQPLQQKHGFARMLDKRTWDQPYKLPSWFSFIAFIFAALLYLVVFAAPAWYKVKPPGDPIEFGIWKLCWRGYCDYDMINEYKVIGYDILSYFSTPYAETVLAVQWMTTFGLLCIVVSFVTYVVFLAGYPTLFMEVIFQFFAAVLLTISICMWGVNLRGPTKGLRYGWAFWVALVDCVVLLINTCFMLHISRKVYRKRHPVMY